MKRPTTGSSDEAPFDVCSSRTGCRAYPQPQEAVVTRRSSGGYSSASLGAPTSTDSTGDGGLRHPGADRLGARLSAAVAAGVLLLVACGESGADSPTLAETAVLASPFPSSTPLPTSTPTTLEEQVVAAYTTFLGAVAESMALRDPQYPRLAELAVGDGLLNGRAGAMTLLDQGTTAEGRFVPAIQRVELNGDRAELEDCYRKDFTYREAQTGRVVDEGGTRFELMATLQRMEGVWKVTQFLEKEFCAPQELEEQILAAYMASDQAYKEAGASADDNHFGMAATTAGNQLEFQRKRIVQAREQGYVHRDFAISHPVVSQVREHDTVAIVRDCVVEDPRTGLYDPRTGQRVSKEQVKPGQRSLLLAQLKLFRDESGQSTWKVVAVDATEEDSKCGPASP